MLESPVPTQAVLLAPIAVSDLLVDTARGPQGTSDVWYQNRRVAWFRFPQAMEVSSLTRRVVAAQSFLFQRVDQTFALDEDEEGLDLDGDGFLRSVHEVFPASAVALCARTLVRTSSTFTSIDDPNGAEIRAAEHPDLASVGTPPILALRDLQEDVLCPREPER